MNHQTLLQLQQLRTRLTWHRRRLQQFADRRGLSLTVVQVLLQDKTREAFLNKEIDRAVDPFYQLENMPQ